MVDFKDKTIGRRCIMFHVRSFPIQRPNSINFVRLFYLHIFWFLLKICRPSAVSTALYIAQRRLFNLFQQLVSLFLWFDKSFYFQYIFFVNVVFIFDLADCSFRIRNIKRSLFNRCLECVECSSIKLWFELRKAWNIIVFISKVHVVLFDWCFAFFWFPIFYFVLFRIVASRNLKCFHEYILDCTCDCFVNSFVTGIVSGSTRKSRNKITCFDINELVFNLNICHKLPCSFSCWRNLTISCNLAWIFKSN